MSEARPRPSDLFGRASIREILEAALLGTENWIRRSGVESDDIELWLDHLWSWVSIGPERFDAWYEGRPDLVDVGRGRGFPPGVATAFATRHVSPQDGHALVSGVTDLVYGHLFGGITWSWVAESIDRVSEVLERYELALPAPNVIGSQGRDEFLGWGNAIPDDVAASHRAIPWIDNGSTLAVRRPPT